MSNVLYSFFSIQQILTKMSVVFAQPLKKESKQDWIYRGEGNANLVISLPDKRQILRIRKTDKPKTFFVWLLNWISDFLYWDSKQELNADSQDLKFYKQVMMPLLGRFVCEATPIFMSRKQTRDLNDAITQCRPSKYSFIFNWNIFFIYGFIAFCDLIRLEKIYSYVLSCMIFFLL